MSTFYKYFIISTLLLFCLCEKKQSKINKRYLDSESYQIRKIIDEYETDSEYLYSTIEANSKENVFYFSYLPKSIIKEKVGAFGLYIEQEETGKFNEVICTFVKDGSEDKTLIEEVEAASKKNISYCYGSRSQTDSKQFNYIFKYKNENDVKPMRMVIKVVKGDSIKGSISLYMRKAENVQIERTDFDTLKEYNQENKLKKSLVPYIIDLENIRGNDTINYVSKILFYSIRLEMQLLYVPEEEELTTPIKLLTGVIIVLETDINIALEKYKSKILILISENLGNESFIGVPYRFRFHTKMFRQDYPIYYYISENPNGRVNNFPINIQIDKCSLGNNNNYFIINYNKRETNKILYFDLIYGKILNKKASFIIGYGMVNYWDNFIEEELKNIYNNNIKASSSDFHIDLIVIKCGSPLLLNLYYLNENNTYDNVKPGDIIIKDIPKKSYFYFSFDKSDELKNKKLLYSISLFNEDYNPSITIQISNKKEINLSNNIVITGNLEEIPDKITSINNNLNNATLIFKFSIEEEENGWEEQEISGLNGKLFRKNNKYAYMFPDGDKKKNFTKVNITLKLTEYKTESIKICVSNNYGFILEENKENCYIIGKNRPYTLTFINPFIYRKNYNLESYNKYYISISPKKENEIFEIEIKEIEYDAKIRNELLEFTRITLEDNKQSVILSLPNYNVRAIDIILHTCFIKEGEISFTVKDSQTGEIRLSGQIGQNKDSERTIFLENIITENQIDFYGTSGSSILLKHVGYNPGKRNSPKFLIKKVTFNPKKGVISIIKPMLNERFHMTLYISKKGKIDFSICDIIIDQENIEVDYATNFYSNYYTNIITHYIDFSSIGYSIGTEFDILAFAEEEDNFKLQFLYEVVSGVVGEIEDFVLLNDLIEGEDGYVTKKFHPSISSNYFYYDFEEFPIGNVATLRVVTKNIKVSKVSCAFVPKTYKNDQMANKVNKAIIEHNNVCIFNENNYDNRFDSIIKINYKNNENRLIIQVLFGSGTTIDLKDSEEEATIYLRINGINVNKEGKIGEIEKYTCIPYVIDLLKLKEENNKNDEKISSILLYSKRKEMSLFYNNDDQNIPINLYNGNIIVLYTDERKIKQKYEGATTLILLIDFIINTEKYTDEENYFFNVRFLSSNNIEYFWNDEGRTLNKPIANKMDKCDKPLYYIMNYNSKEEKKELHMDIIYGEIDTIKYVKEFEKDNWDYLISNMTDSITNKIIFDNNKIHFDIVEIKCKFPLLLNFYYADPNSYKVSNLEIGDISVISLQGMESQILTFKLDEENNPNLIYSFNILSENSPKPNIKIIFQNDEILEIKENGIFLKKITEKIGYLTIKNLGEIWSYTRIIFGYNNEDESQFEKNENDLYFKNNIRFYKYGPEKKNIYKNIDFLISISDENTMEICYNENLGIMFKPSMKNCFLIKKENPYTLSTINPFTMNQNYNYNGNEEIKYYISFEEFGLNENIKILPIIKRYNITERYYDENPNIVIIPEGDIYDTVLTPPENKEPYIFIQMGICTEDKEVFYNLINSYNSSSIINENISKNTKYYSKIIKNIYSDIELKLESHKDTKIFIKYAGINSKYQIIVNEIKLNYDKNLKKFNWNQPIENEEFKYTIYIDKKNNIKTKNYTLCNIEELNKIHYNKIIINADKNPNIIIDFGKSELVDYEDDFEAIILAEQINERKIIMLSNIYSSDNQSSSNILSSLGYISLASLAAILLRLIIKSLL